MNVDRLQGTDGVRGKVCIAKSSSSNNPISAFLEEGVLTEEFFELYLYSYCTELLDTKFAKKRDSVVIGWDPREIPVEFYSSAIKGIRKSGLNAVVVDILPTPAISLYQVHTAAAFGVVLTASHNPSDQSGIKIFLGYSNLKLFPEDDKRLTKLCFKLNFEKIKKLPIIGKCRNEHLEARKLFIQFMKNIENHWVNENNLNGITVVVDCANGAFSGLINDLINFEFINFVVTNDDINKGINLNSGVADLEGVEKIFPADLDRGAFSNYDSLKMILKLGRKKRKMIQKSYEMVLGIVFDGDGDRCFLLIYDPFNDDILVIGGDLLSFFQAKFLYKKYYSSSKYFFINTIESDLEATRVAEKLGFSQIQCAVGDKWILWHAFYNQFLSKLDFYLDMIDDPEFINLLDETKLLLENMIKCSKLDALNATKKLIVIENWVREKKGEGILIKASNFLCKRENNRFAIGCEESGHLINLGINSLDNQDVPVFIGNSFKCAINSISAIKEFRSNKNTPELFDWLKNPFPKGYKKSLQVYYVDKSLLNKNSSVRKELIDRLKLYSKWPNVKVKFEKLFEEPEMVFFRSFHNEKCVASLFIRNSGTEEKMAIYLRGIEKLAPYLDELAEKIYPFLLSSFKNKKSLMAQSERLILERLKEGPKDEKTLIHSEFQSISFDRLLHEMSSRQNLIEKNGNNWKITNIGLSFLNFSERSE